MMDNKETIKALKKMAYEIRTELERERDHLLTSDIMYDEGYISGFWYVINILEGTKTLPKEKV